MHVKFTELPVKDQDRALAFYTNHLGLTVDKDAAYRGDWRWIELAMPEAQTNLVMSQSTMNDRPESPTLVFVVDDLKARHSRLLDAGVEIVQWPEIAQWNPSELSVLFYDSEDNLILITSTQNQQSLRQFPKRVI